jgi:predicted glutamine amidotransferase
MVVASINCHPFRHEQYMFMQNGGIARFCAVKRRLCACLSDEAFHVINGTTDTEHVFAALVEVLCQTKRAALPAGGNCGATRLRADSCDSVARASQDGLRLAAALRTAIVLVSAIQRSVGLSAEESSSSLNFALTDGELVVASRCRTYTEDAPPSLYYHCAPSIAVAVKRRSALCGSAGRHRTPQHCRLSPHLAAMPEPGGADCSTSAAPGRGRQVIIASEPIDFEDTASRQARRDECGPRRQKWQLIKKDSVLIATSDYGVLVAPLSLPAWEDLPPLSDGGGAWSGLGADFLSALYYESYVVLERAVEAAELAADAHAVSTGSLGAALAHAFTMAEGGVVVDAAPPLPDALPFLDLGAAEPVR